MTVINDDLVKQAGEYHRAAKAAMEAGDYDHWQFCRDQLLEMQELAHAEPESWICKEIDAMLFDMPVD